MLSKAFRSYLFLCWASFSILALIFSPTAEAKKNKDRVVPSGFLDDYSQLEPVSTKRLKDALLYVHPDFQLGTYEKCLIERPLIFLHPEARGVGVDPTELAELTDAFYEAGVKQLSEACELVEEPGPGVLVIRTAITDVDPVNRAANIAGKVFLKVVTVDLGRASIEVELLDGESGERMLAMVDTKVGNRFGPGFKSGSLKRWGHTKTAFKEWAKAFRKRLQEKREELAAAEASSEPGSR